MAEDAPEQVRNIKTILKFNFQKTFSLIINLPLGQSYRCGRAFGLDTFEFGRTRICENEERKGT